MLFIGASFRWDGIGCEGQLSSGPEQIALTLYYHLCVDLASLARVSFGLEDVDLSIQKLLALSSL